MFFRSFYGILYNSFVFCALCIKHNKHNILCFLLIFEHNKHNILCFRIVNDAILHIVIISREKYFSFFRKKRFHILYNVNSIPARPRLLSAARRLFWKKFYFFSVFFRKIGALILYKCKEQATRGNNNRAAALALLLSLFNWTQPIVLNRLTFDSALSVRHN